MCVLATQSCPDGVEVSVNYLKLEGAVTTVVGKVHNIASKRNALWSFMCVCVCVCVHVFGIFLWGSGPVRLKLWHSLVS